MANYYYAHRFNDKTAVTKPGLLQVEGPFASYDEAKKHKQTVSNFGYERSSVFQAESKQAAEKLVKDGVEPLNRI